MPKGLPSVLLAAVLLSACKEDRDTPRGDPSPPANAKEGATKGASGDPTDVRLHPDGGPLKTQLADGAAKAKARGLTAYAELRADWCDPCVALEKSMSDPRMIDAFAGTYVMHLDVDEWSAKDVEGTGLKASVIPIFYALDGDGKPTGRTIDGGAWGENVPENMAPPLKKFFHP